MSWEWDYHPPPPPPLTVLKKRWKRGKYSGAKKSCPPDLHETSPCLRLPCLQILNGRHFEHYFIATTITPVSLDCACVLHIKLVLYHDSSSRELLMFNLELWDYLRGNVTLSLLDMNFEILTIVITQGVKYKFPMICTRGKTDGWFCRNVSYVITCLRV